MKNIVAWIVLAISLSLNADTWTIHGFKDNYLSVWCFGPGIDFVQNEVQCGGGSWQCGASWDYWWDQANPENVDSGQGSIYVDANGGIVQASNPGYFDTQILTSFPVLWPTNDSPSGISIDLAGPFDWLGEVWITIYPLPNAGHYWIDFDSVGSMRISTTQPTDFGKWAWDGSINPSWIEPPLAPVQHKRGKGHNK